MINFHRPTVSVLCSITLIRNVDYEHMPITNVATVRSGVKRVSMF